ncbi:MAG: transposase [Desulfobacteraceae bacterium]|nr:transposase [Desulfobacteraceae bacterium]
MHLKDIKLIVRKQLKKQFPNWKRLTRKEKKEIAKKVLSELVADYDFKQTVTAPKEDLLGIEQQMPSKGIINLNAMSHLIDTVDKNRIIKLSNCKRSAIYIKDKELQFVDELLDDRILNRLLANEGYTPAKRDLFPNNFFRAELLKAIKYPEISYRKFCTEEYLGLDRKQNRVFIGLPLNKKDMIDHTQLSKFRSSISFVQQVNLLVYILHHFFQSGLLGENQLHAIDSTELVNDCKIPLATLNINGKKIRIYSDIDSDCGKRRNKRDKSTYVIGYRLHTLTAIDVKSGQSFPLVSLLAPANHHDSHFLPFLVNLAQAMGIDLKLITADEAYHDKDGSLFAETGVILTTPPSAKVLAPEHTDTATGDVFCHAQCDFPMLHVGVENQMHEYKCNAAAGECMFSGKCPRYRLLPVDGGFFQHIPHYTDLIQEAHDLRKNCERPFNLLKNQAGLETVRVRSQHATMARCTLSSIAVLLIKMAGQRKKKSTVKSRQLPLYPEQKAA